jgi:putative copper export protein/methionine-rich copper-binding protein CopC
MTNVQPVLRQKLVHLVLGIALAAGLASMFSPTAFGAAGTNEVVSSNPASGSTLQVPPTQIQLTFKNAVEGDLAVELLCGPGADVPVALSAPATEDNVVYAIPLLGQQPENGQCVVKWSIASSASAGSISFVLAVTQDSAAIATDTTAVAPGETVSVIGETVTTYSGDGRTTGVVVGLLRIAQYLFVSALFGGLILMLLAWPEGVEYPICLRFFKITWLLSIVTMYVLVAMNTFRHSNDGFASALSPFSWFSHTGGADGAVLILRFVLIAASFWVAFMPERIIDPATQVPALTIVVAMMATFGLTRLGQDVSIFSYVVGVAHALAIGLWVGGMILLIRTVLTAPGDADLVQAVIGFAKISGPLMVAAVVTGFAHMLLLDGLAIFTSGHGRLNVLTIVLTALMVVVALMVKEFVVNRFARTEELTGKMAWRMRRALSVEVIIGIVVFGVTSWMIPMKPPQAFASAATRSVAYEWREELQNERFHVVLSISPATTGTNAMRIELLNPSRINNFTITLTPPDPGFEGIQVNVPIKRRGAAIVAYDGLFNLKVAGVWSIEIKGATTTGELVPLATTLNVVQSATPETTVPTETTVGG